MIASLAAVGCTVPAAPQPGSQTPALTETPRARTPSPKPTGTPSPSTGERSPRSATLLAAGDIGDCDSENDTATSALLEYPGTIATLGDAAYPDGSADDFKRCFAPTWGRYRDRIRPAPGNHEYETAGAAGYFDYFGAAAGPRDKGYYSYDLGAWRVVVVNSNCGAVGGCHAGSAQERWLRADLATSRRHCTLAYWHHPLFTSGAVHDNATELRPIFQALYDAGAEVVLAGHNHQYERFAPQTPTGHADRIHGVREFVVGTGGANLYGFGDPQPNSEVRDSDTHGVLRLTLRPDGYDWRFLPAAGGRFTDTGSDTCHASGRLEPFDPRGSATTPAP